MCCLRRDRVVCASPSSLSGDVREESDGDEGKVRGVLVIGAKGSWCWRLVGEGLSSEVCGLVGAGARLTCSSRQVRQCCVEDVIGG